MLTIAFAMQTACLCFVSPVAGPRLHYAVSELFGRRLGLEVSLILPGEPLPPGAIRVGYGTDCLLPFSFSGILDENPGKTEFRVHWHEDWRQSELVRPGFEPVAGDLPGLLFYLLSRYEEWANPGWEDEHNRFPDWNHSHVKAGLHGIPLAEVWVQELAVCLLEAGLHPVPPVPSPQFSADLDHLSRFRHKPFLRTAGGLLLDLFRSPATAVRRLQTLVQRKEDPFEGCFDRLLAWSRNRPGFRFFFWCGDSGPFDTGLNWQHPFFSRCVKQAAGNAHTGLHLSYSSFRSQTRTRTECERLKEISGRSVTENRFHFLRFRVEEGWERLTSAGIKTDYSMGFSAFPGYRAGTGLPFRAYCLPEEKVLDLELIPFCLMDSPFFHRMGGDPADFLAAATGFLRPVSGVSPGFHLILHNEFADWPGWQEILTSLSGMAGPPHFTR